MPESVVLKPVEGNFSLGDHIYSELREALLELDVYNRNADLRLDERRIAKQMGVSRTPIREALTRLAQEGFVTIQARKGIFINRKDLPEILELVKVWAALESMAARLACEVASDEAISELRMIAAQFSKDQAKANIDEYSETNIDFHGAIMRISGCRKLQELGEDVFAHLVPIRRRAMRDVDRADRSVVDHMNIIEAVEGREADLADRLVREHTFRLHDYIASAWKGFMELESMAADAKA